MLEIALQLPVGVGYLPRLLTERILAGRLLGLTNRCPGHSGLLL
jgi:hypothetical protein